MKRSLRSWLWRVDVTREVDEEIAFHVEMRTRELIDRGVDPRIAREMVLARMGGCQPPQTHMRGPRAQKGSRDASDAVVR